MPLRGTTNHEKPSRTPELVRGCPQQVEDSVPSCLAYFRSRYLAFDILEKAHVGVTPGIDFGENGEEYLRFSYANSMENLVEGLDRIENYLEHL
jgi:aspartate/methionine/tyrosine aminotransferase